jgi:2-polyprenyl-3-methyl-5-hydroxy-6-metoxy-1,4-benzoquinol methylase
VEPDDLACTTALLASYDTVVRCLDCGLFYTNPRASNGEIMAAYGEMADRGFLKERRARELTYRRLLKSLDRVTGGRKGRLLDVGCSMGFFLKEARDAGWQVEGMEPSGWAAEYARSEFGLNVRKGPAASAPVEPASFDAITMWDVVEHLLDPVGDLRRLAVALKPGGVFALSTHSIASVSARLLGRRYPFLMSMHVTHFTSRATARLFEMAGLRQIRIEPHVRFIRVGYLVKKLGPKAPGAAAVLGALAGRLGLTDRHVAIVGLGIFNAYASRR